LVEDELVIFGGDQNGIAFVQRAFKNFLGERVFKKAFYRVAHRTRAVLRVVTFFNEQVFRLFVEFEPEAHVSLFGLERIQEELAELLGRKVDLIPRKSLSKYLRDEVFAEEETLYVAA